MKTRSLLFSTMCAVSMLQAKKECAQTNQTSQTFFSSYASSSNFVRIDDKDFEHTQKTENGVTTEQYLINRVPVDKEQYDQELREAQLNTMRKKDDAQQKKSQARALLQQDIQSALVQKVLVRLLQDMTYDLSILQHPLLEPYLVFNKSIATKDTLAHIARKLQVALERIDHLAIQKKFAELERMQHEFERDADAIAECVQASVRQAIAKCDDTRVLKQLLELVETE